MNNKYNERESFPVAVVEGISRITVEMPYYLLGKRAMNGKYLNIPSLNPLMLLESSSSKEQGKSAAQR